MDILVGLIMLAVGLALVFAGLRVFAVALPILGFIAGVSLGLAIMHWAFDQNILATATGIVVGVIFGFVFAALSYFFWYVAVILGSALIGSSAGAGLMNLFGVDTAWVVALAAFIGGILFAALAMLLDLPVYWVIVATAFNGAAWAIAGTMLVFDRINREELSYGTVWAVVEDNRFWVLVWIILAAVGIGSQLSRLAEAMLPQERWSRIPRTQM